jgi:hypothetical protein
VTVTPPKEVGKSPFHVAVVEANPVPQIVAHDPGSMVLAELYTGLMPPALMLGPATVNVCVTGVAAT